MKKTLQQKKADKTILNILKDMLKEPCSAQLIYKNTIYFKSGIVGIAETQCRGLILIVETGTQEINKKVNADMFQKTEAY